MLGDKELDCVTVLFGIRSFRVDAETGFWLNGKNLPLCGVARHQDRENMGFVSVPVRRLKRIHSVR